MENPTANSSELLERIQERYAKLRKSERLVADYLREHSGKRLEMSITEFADALGLSEATISRFTRAIGYRGYADMKLSVAASSSVSDRFSNIPLEISESDTLIETSRKLVNALASSLFETQKFLDHDSIDQAIEAIRQAQKVVLIGVGGAASVCDEAAHMFLKAGIDAVSYRDGYTQTIAAAATSKNAAVIGVSHTGTTRTVGSALRLARMNGAPTIAITSDAESFVAQSAENVLLTRYYTAPQIPLYGDFLEGRVCQLYLIDLLYLGLLFRSGATAEEKLRATTDALERHYRRPE